MASKARSNATSFVVVRPFVDDEATTIPPAGSHPREVLQWDGKDCLTVLDPQEDFAPRRNGTFKGTNVIWSLAGAKDPGNSGHAAASQRDVYDRAVKPVISKIVEGYNATFLVAGGAGSGRAYALYGDNVDGVTRGILPRFAEDIFDAFDKLDHESSTLSTQVEVVDISGEQYLDVLAVKKAPNNRKDDDGTELKVVSGGEDGPRLSGATEAEINGASDLRTVLKQVMRTIRKRNTTHTVTLRFQETFEFEDPDNYGQSISQSRRIQVTFILLRNVAPAFQRCIDVAIEHDSGENPLAKVPVRETALTKLFPGVLQQEFDLTFISCVSPYYESVREALSTLQFATKVRKLVGYPQLNQDEELVDMRRLADEVKTLKTQVKKQNEAMDVVQNELNTREVDLMKQEAAYNQANRDLKNAQDELKCATIGRNMQADRTRVFRKDMDGQLRTKRAAIQKTQSVRGASDEAYEKNLRDADDAKARRDALEAKVTKQQQNTVVYQKRLQDYEAEEKGIKGLEDFNIASPDEQERLVIAKSTAHHQADEELKKVRANETRVRASKDAANEKSALKPEHDKVVAAEAPRHERQALLDEMAALEKEIAAAKSETQRLANEIDQKKSQCCTTM